MTTIAIDPWRALADPTRRSILEILFGGRISVGDLAEKAGMSQPLTSQHLRVLLEAGLVQVSKEGKSRIYGLREDGFREVATWLAHYEAFWSTGLDSLGEYLSESEIVSEGGSRP